MADITNDRRSGAAGNNAPVRQHDEGDGTWTEAVAAHLRAWDATAGETVRLLADHTTGALITTSSAAGGGAATIADGADVAQGTTSDVAWVSGAGTVISLLKKIASAGGSAVSVADGADVAQGATTDLSSANTVVGILKAIKAAITGTLTTTTSWAAAQHVIVDTGPTATGNVASGATDSGNPVKVGGAYHAAVQNFLEGQRGDAQIDSAGNIRVVIRDGRIGTDTLAVFGSDGGDALAPGYAHVPVRAELTSFDGVNWNRARGDIANGVDVDVTRLPVGHNIIDAGSAVIPVNDNAGSLTVDAPVGTPAFVRLSDGAAAITTLPVSLATNTPDVTDRAARLLGIVDKGKIWDGTNIAAVKAASALAAAADPALVVQLSPQSAQASTLWVTALSAANTTVTLTLPAAAAGLFHYITHIEIVNLNPTTTAIAASATTLSYTTTNIPGSPAFSCGNALGAGATFTVANFSPATPIKSSVAATGTTIVAPAIGTGGLVRMNVTYYTAP